MNRESQVRPISLCKASRPAIHKFQNSITVCVSVDHSQKKKKNHDCLHERQLERVTLTLVSPRLLRQICIIILVEVVCISLDTNGTAVTAILDDTTVATLRCQIQCCALSYVARRTVFRDFNALPPRNLPGLVNGRHLPGR